LDLSNNNLTNQGQSKDEVQQIAKALEKNKTLLYLNLSNNSLEEIIGNQFIISTNINKDLICFEYGFNDFLLHQI